MHRGAVVAVAKELSPGLNLFSTRSWVGGDKRATGGLDMGVGVGDYSTKQKKTTKHTQRASISAFFFSGFFTRGNSIACICILYTRYPSWQLHTLSIDETTKMYTHTHTHTHTHTTTSKNASVCLSRICHFQPHKAFSPQRAGQETKTR